MPHLVTGDRRWLIVILLLAAFCRFYAVLHFPAAPVADAADYQRLAFELSRSNAFVNDHGLPTAWRPPLYPAFLAFVYRWGGPEGRASYFTQALLGSFTV